MGPGSLTNTPTMPDQIKPIAAIEAEARAAAAKHDNVNDACPYSFYTEAGRTYKRAFQQERLAINMRKTQGQAAVVEERRL